MFLSLLLTACLGADSGELAIAADAPARGSVPGPWALVDAQARAAFFLGGGFSQEPSSLSATLALVGGVGFEVSGVRISPTARFNIGPTFGRLSGLRWSSLALALAVPDVIHDQKHTGLRLTPALGVTLPTGPQAFAGRNPVTVVSAAAQLERRFGVLELALRIEGSRAITLPGCAAADCSLWKWDLDNRLFAEVWVLPSLSIGLGFLWSTRWSGLPVQPQRPAQCDLSDPFCAPISDWSEHAVSGQVVVSWAFTPLFGVGVDGTVGHQLVRELNLGGVPLHLGGNTTIGVSASLWFRTDQGIARNWIER